MSLCGLYKKIFSKVKLVFPSKPFVRKILCVVVFFVYVWNILILCMWVIFVVCLLHVCFCRKFMRLPYWVWTIPFVLNLFVYIRRIRRFFFCSLIYFFQNLVVHHVAFTFGNHTMDIESKILVHYHSILDKYWLNLFNSI